jgi:hypothetical protein
MNLHVSLPFALEYDHQPPARWLWGVYARVSSQSLLFTFRIPGFAAYEHRSSTQPNDWSYDEPPREMRYKESSICESQQEPTFV